MPEGEGQRIPCLYIDAHHDYRYSLFANFEQVLTNFWTSFNHACKSLFENSLKGCQSGEAFSAGTGVNSDVHEDSCYLLTPNHSLLASFQIGSKQIGNYAKLPSLHAVTH